MSTQSRLVAGQGESLVRSTLVMKAIFVLLACMAVYCAVLFQDAHLLGRDRIPTDFDAFYDAGTMALRGDVAGAYDIEAMMAEQNKDSDERVFMPWTYPPPYTLAMAGLAMMPVGLAYFLFISISGLAYLAVLRKLAGPYFPGAMVAMMPAMAIVVRTGQNGFLTGALVGLFMLAFMNRKVWAGIPLGLMIIKPHLAVGISLLSLLGRRWEAMAVAAAIVLVTLAGSTLVFGADVWPAFMGSVRDSTGFLAAAFYPLERMTSFYATFRTLGASAEVSMLAQIVSAFVALGVIVWGWWRNLQPRYLAALVCVASLFISPYNYDYDLMIFGVAVALLLPDFVKKSRPLERFGVFALIWVASGIGMLLQYSKEGVVDFSKPETMLLSPSISSLLIVIISVFSAIVLMRKPHQNVDIIM